MSNAKAKTTQQKKDRPKSSDKLRKKRGGDGTPEKSLSPGVEEEEAATVTKSVIDGEDVQRLVIREDDLRKIREDIPVAPRHKTPPVKAVTVKKTVAHAQSDAKTKVVTVARGAPPNAPLRPFDYGAGGGPRFDAKGTVIPHSILGSLEDFKMEAKARGELEIDFHIPEEEEPRAATPLLVPAGKRRRMVHPKQASVGESNALANWRSWMTDRQRQQGYISRLLEKSAERLTMNQGDSYREKQELRYLIDRSMPAVDYGKGYRVGSEFWKQLEPIGDEETGIHMTNTQTEMGYPPPVEHIGVPRAVQAEKGLSSDIPPTALNHPWHMSRYLAQRREHLSQVIEDLDPHVPDIDRLEIIGTNNPYVRPLSRRIRRSSGHDVQGDKDEAAVAATEDDYGDENSDPLSAYPDVYPEPVFGPSIQFAGNAARWTGSHSFRGAVAAEARVQMEACAGERATSFVNIVNDGTTAIYYDWAMVPKTNPFDLVDPKVQRFYFNTSSGALLPGKSLKFPFVFKSDKVGIFTEQWHFQTRPVLAGGAAMLVTLRGKALQVDKYKREREQVEVRLLRGATERMVRSIVDDIVDCMTTPERPSSPVDAYLTEVQAFEQRNPSLVYDHDAVTRIKELYASHWLQGGREGAPEWDLGVGSFKQAIADLREGSGEDGDDANQKAYYLEQLNGAVLTMCAPAIMPRQEKLYRVAYQLLGETIDSMVNQAVRLQAVLGLPEREPEDLRDTRFNAKKESSKPPAPPGGAAISGAAAAVAADASGLLSKTPRPESKEGGKKMASKAKDDGKDKKVAKADVKGASKESKPKEQQPAAAAAASAGVVAKGKASPTKKPLSGKANGRTTPGGSALSVEGSGGGGVGSVSSPSPGGVLLPTERLYREKLYSQAYQLLNDFLTNMCMMFDDLHLQEDAKLAA